MRRNCLLSSARRKASCMSLLLSQLRLPQSSATEPGKSRCCSLLVASRCCSQGTITIWSCQLHALIEEWMTGANWCWTWQQQPKNKDFHPRHKEVANCELVLAARQLFDPSVFLTHHNCNTLICLQLATHRAPSCGTHGVVTHSQKMRFSAHRTSCC